MRGKAWRRTVARSVAACALLACKSKRPAVRDTPDGSAATSRGLVDELVDESSKYARDELGLRTPKLSYVLIGCVDSAGRIDRASAQCPGSVVASFEDAAAPSALPAFVVNGPKGVLGYRGPRDAFIVLGPARCTPTTFLATARAHGIAWASENGTHVSYGPRIVGGAVWSVERQGAAIFSMSDDECATGDASP